MGRNLLSIFGLRQERMSAKDATNSGSMLSLNNVSRSRNDSKHTVDGKTNTIIAMDNTENESLINSEGITRQAEGVSESVSESNDNLSYLYDEAGNDFLFNYLKVFTQPNTQERAAMGKGKKSNKLGLLLGVYLPTIQHILGVTMFIRLFWVVGIAGLAQTCYLLAICCVTTFVTCISLAAVATNGEMKSGGAYFMVSRNLGADMGTAIGILFYLGNAVATSMYLVGGVEILLIYIFPDLTIGGREIQSDTGFFGMMSHNLRVYATLLLLVEFVIVAMGVRFVQLFAPISLFCVILSVLSCFAGGIEKTIIPSSGQRVCKIGDHLLQANTFMPPNASLDNICKYCTERHVGHNITGLCWNGTCALSVQCVNGYPGISRENFQANLGSFYMKEGEYLPGKRADQKTEVSQDVTTTFFVLLAIYFPAVTGILTGANMSGDLKDPQRAIPLGTISAQITTTTIYFGLAIIFGLSIDGDVLRDKYGQSMAGSMVVANLAWPNRWVLLIGSFTSTFGAALQCLCSAPRLLQCIAEDNVIPTLKPFAKLTKRGEPFNGLLITTLIAELAILIGAMDHIAAVVDFFFLMCYACINCICAMFSSMKSPDWRPVFKYYHETVSVAGAFLCFFIMFSTHWYYAVLTCFLCFVIFQRVNFVGGKNEWGGGIHGFSLSAAQKALMREDDKPIASNFFRPQILLIITLEWREEVIDVRYMRLLHLASQLKAGRGLTVLVAFLRGDPLDAKERAYANEIYHRMKRDMRKVRLNGFVKTLVYNEKQIAGSITAMIQSAGIGPLKPNTLLLKWPRHREDWLSEPADSEYHTFIDKLYTGFAMSMCLLVAKEIINFPEIRTSKVMNGLIDVYWIIQDGGFVGLIAYLLHQHKVWKNCELRVLGICPGRTEGDTSGPQLKKKLQLQIQEYLRRLRLEATVEVVQMDPRIPTAAFERTLLMEERVQYAREMRKMANRANMERRINLANMRSKSIDMNAGRPDIKLNLLAGKHNVISETIASTPESGRGTPGSKPDISVDVTPTTGKLDEISSADTTIATTGTQVLKVSRFTIAKHEDTPLSSGGVALSVNALPKEDKKRKDSFEVIDTAETDTNDNVADIMTFPRAAGRRMTKKLRIMEDPQMTEERMKKFQNLDLRKVGKMHSAVQLNEIMKNKSKNSSLILLNLPKPPAVKEAFDDYMHYLEELTEGLPRVLFVRGSGAEVLAPDG